MFYYKISWFYQDFKSANLCFLNLYLRIENNGPFTRDHVKSSQMRNETPLQVFPSS